MRILCFGLNPTTVYSTKYRLEKYKNFFKENGVEIDITPTLQMSDFTKLYNKHKLLGDFSYYCLHCFEILVSVISSVTYDAVFVQRHLFPGKTSFMEKLLIKCNPNIIFDFDDAIFSLPKHFRYKNWKTDPNARNEFNKVVRLVKASKLVIAGNNYLKEYALKYNKNIIVVPTPIDVELYTKPKTTFNLHKPIRIGWYGSWGNQPYLETAVPAIKKLAKKYPLKLVVVSDKEYYKQYDFIENVKWSEDLEENQLKEFDIAIAPLPVDEWTKGKCGYKIMKYMICQVPSVVTPIEIQKEIIDHGINGYHASTLKEWEMYIEKLIKSQKIRKKFGIKSRNKVIKYYSRPYLGKKVLQAITNLKTR